MNKVRGYGLDSSASGYRPVSGLENTAVNLETSVTCGKNSILTRGRGVGVRFSARARDLYLPHSVQTGSGAYPAAYPMGIGGSFSRGKETGTLI
jgi:hypothetical protein